MQNTPYKITVIVITYNQEELIKRALNSILIQKDWGLYKIVVCEDCSTDNTWNVVMAYKERYPDIIEAYHNNPNLGIYGNLQKGVEIVKKSDTDIVFMCAGDDALCDGIFREAIQLIEREKVDVKNELFSIYCDWKSILPNGKERIFYNNLIAKGYNPLSLKLRGLVFNRSVCSSINVVRKYKYIPLYNGVAYAESLFDVQLQMFSKKSYYSSFVGSIYYCGIGVSTNMNNESVIKSRILACEVLYDNSLFSKLDKKYIKYKINRYRYAIKPSFYLFCNTWYYFISSINIQYGIKKKSVVKDFIHMISLFVKR